MGGSDGSVGKQDVLKVIVAGRHDGSAFVDFGGIKKIEYGEMLNSQDPVHALKAQTTLAIQEIGDMGLLESGLLSQTEASEISLVDTLPKSSAEVVLQDSEFHRSGV